MSGLLLGTVACCQDICNLVVAQLCIQEYCAVELSKHKIINYKRNYLQLYLEKNVFENQIQCTRHTSQIRCLEFELVKIILSSERIWACLDVYFEGRGVSGVLMFSFLTNFSLSYKDKFWCHFSCLVELHCLLKN